MNPSRPNIILILADDLGYGDFGAFNGQQSNTPTLDGLMSEGLCFSQSYTASCVCNPSRAALLTGRYPHRTGSIDTLEWRGLERLALRETTLADVFKSAGYATGLIGKWHLGAFDPRYHPNARGFDETVCFRGGMHDYYDWRLEWNDEVRRGDGRYLTDVWASEATEFIERHQKEPFFLHLTFNAPHTPLQAPTSEVAPFAETGKFSPGVATLYGMVHRMDTAIAQVLDALKKHGLEDNTIVWFSSDNGPQFGSEKGEDLRRFNCDLRGGKGNCYEGGIRVPLLLRWPAGLPSAEAGGREVRDFVHFVDWFPTLLSLAGVPVPKHLKLDGADISPLLRGEKSKVETRRFWQWNRYTPLVTCNAAMRDGPWKLVRPVIREAMQVPDIHFLPVSMFEPEHFIEHGIIREPEPPREVPEPPPAQLFDLERDPLETTDLALEQPDRARRMLRELEIWFEEIETERATIGDD